MERSHTFASLSPRNRCSDPIARTKVSCVTSSADRESVRYAQYRQTSTWLRSTKEARASRSPVWALRARAVSELTPPFWNHIGLRGDSFAVTDEIRVLGPCAAARESLSAEIDGEASGNEVASARSHLVTCGDCRDWLRAVERLQRKIRVRPADLVPDLSGVVLERAHPPQPGRAEWVRYALVVVALTQLVIAIPDLLDVSAVVSVHDSRHLGAMAVALSLGLLYTAHRPVRAYGILPVVAALAITMIGAAFVDIVRGSAVLLSESIHVLEMIGFVLVWMLAGSPGWRSDRTRMRYQLRRVVDREMPSARRRKSA